MRKLISEDERNGTVFNAKGDIALLGNITATVDNPNTASEGEIGLFFYQDGTYSITAPRGGTLTIHTGQPATGFWVDTTAPATGQAPWGDYDNNPATPNGCENYKFTRNSGPYEWGTIHWYPVAVDRTFNEYDPVYSPYVPGPIIMAELGQTAGSWTGMGYIRARVFIQNGTANGTWSITISNLAPGQQNPESRTITINLTAIGHKVAVGTGGCFIAGTQVLMSDGVTTKAIEDIVETDEVLSYEVPNRIDESDPTWIDWNQASLVGGSNTTSTVTSTDIVMVTEFYGINGMGITNHHRLLTFSPIDSLWKWRTPSEMTVGDTFRDAAGTDVTISTIVVENPTSLDTYTIGVETVDTFFVAMGDKFIVAHNK